MIRGKSPEGGMIIDDDPVRRALPDYHDIDAADYAAMIV